MRQVVICTLAAAILMIAAGPEANAGLVGYWNFNGNVNDQTANGNNGTPSNLTYVAGAPAPLTGQGITQSGSFDGASTKVQVAVPSTSSPLYMNTQETITMWVNGNAADQNGSFMRSFSTAAGGKGIEFQESPNSQDVAVRIDTSTGNNQLFDIGNAYNGNWNFLAVVLNGNSIQTYLNGVLATNSTFNLGSGFGTTNPITLGNSDQEGGDWFKGQMSNVALYNGPLTGAQIALLFNGTAPATIPEPSSLVLAGVGIAGMLFAARRRRKA
jgi:hypothetical protein